MRERTYLVAEVQLVVERVELELDAVAVGGRHRPAPPGLLPVVIPPASRRTRAPVGRRRPPPGRRTPRGGPWRWAGCWPAPSASTVKIATGTRNLSTRRVLPDKEADMEDILHPRVRYWTNSCTHRACGYGCGYILPIPAYPRVKKPRINNIQPLQF